MRRSASAITFHYSSYLPGKLATKNFCSFTSRPAKSMVVYSRPVMELSLARVMALLRLAERRSGASAG